MTSRILALLVLAWCGLASAQPTAAEWEYGTLFLGTEVASWFAPGSDVREVAPADLSRELQASFGEVAMALDTDGLLAGVLNVLGFHGWELVGVSGDTYVFKRPTARSVEDLPFLGR